VTLFMVPSLYVAANDINRKIASWRHREPQPILGIAADEEAA